MLNGSRISRAAVSATPRIARVLDLNMPMLAKARERVTVVNGGAVETFHTDFRDACLEPASYDVMLTAAALRRLRTNADWEAAFQKIYNSLTPGGSVWISDMVCHDHAAIHALM